MKLKKVGAIILAVMMMVMVATAFASETPEELTNGKVGEFTDYNSASAATTGENSKQDLTDSVNIKKQIISINANGSDVNAPVVTYTYTVTPATIEDDTTVTDAAAKHASGEAVTAPVNAGPTTGLVVTGTSAGSAGNDTSASGTLVFTNATTLTSSNDGTGDGINEYDINLDFSNVTFSQAGVYRYQIAETISAASYDAVALEDGEINTTYLDVYVDGEGNIYGYVCMTTNGSVTTSTTKTNGFVANNGTGTLEGKEGADRYYTYDLTLSKDVVNDNYAEGNVAFPFTVIFNNTENYTSTFTITETAATGSTGISPAAASAPTWSGVALVKDGANITYTGIPAGVDVDVFETNIVTGVTYNVSTAVNSGDAVTDNGVTAGSTPASAVAQTTANKQAYQSTKVTVNTPKIAEVEDVQTVEITNTLSLISPTGLVLRYAPYMLILVGGIALLLIAKKHKKHTDEE